MKLYAFPLAAALLFPSTASARGSDTLTDLVAASGGAFDQNLFDYDILLNAVLAAGLDTALADPTFDGTLFAPNDLAFIFLARDLGYTGFSEDEAFTTIVDALTGLGGGDPIPLLTDILLYHVSPDNLRPLQVIFANSIDTLQGATITPRLIRLQDNEPDLRDPFLFIPLNVRASNGRLHTITRVLLPIDVP